MYYFSESFGGITVPCSTLKVRGYICPTLDKFFFIHGTSQRPLIFKIATTCKYFLFFYPLDLIPSPLHGQLALLLNFYFYSLQPLPLLHSRSFWIPASRLQQLDPFDLVFRGSGLAVVTGSMGHPLS